MNLSDYVLSLVRTWVPVGVGALLSWLASIGLELGEEANVALVTFGTALLTAVYYAVARAIEARWPRLGAVLLGSAKKPAYEAPR